MWSSQSRIQNSGFWDVLKLYLTHWAYRTELSFVPFFFFFNQDLNLPYSPKLVLQLGETVTLDKSVWLLPCGKIISSSFSLQWADFSSGEILPCPLRAPSSSKYPGNKEASWNLDRGQGIEQCRLVKGERDECRQQRTSLGSLLCQDLAVVPPPLLVAVEDWTGQRYVTFAYAVEYSLTV